MLLIEDNRPASRQHWSLGLDGGEKKMRDVAHVLLSIGFCQLALKACLAKYVSGWREPESVEDDGMYRTMSR